MNPVVKSPAESRLFFLLDAHHRIAISCLVALVAFLLVSHWMNWGGRILVGWDTFAFTSVVLAWIILLTRDPYEVRRHARIEDSSATVLFTFVVSAAVVSLLAVGLLLGSAKSLPPFKLGVYVGLSMGAVLFSWLLVHTLFAVRYAHLYYANAREKQREHASGGLDFPGDDPDNPDYLDFAYFSFVVGMTCQVSDVQITSRRMRRLALVHGLIAFCFNTAILAMFVNIIASLL